MDKITLYGVSMGSRGYQLTGAWEMSVVYVSKNMWFVFCVYYLIPSQFILGSVGGF